MLLVILIYFQNFFDIIHIYYALGGGCNITTIVAIVQYNNNRRRLNLIFLSNLRGHNAHFECRIDNQRFRSCKLFI